MQNYCDAYQWEPATSTCKLGQYNLGFHINYTAGAVAGKEMYSYVGMI